MIVDKKLQESVKLVLDNALNHLSSITHSNEYLVSANHSENFIEIMDNDEVILKYNYKKEEVLEWKCNDLPTAYALNNAVAVLCPSKNITFKIHQMAYTK
jgi:hypothetical protein